MGKGTIPIVNMEGVGIDTTQVCEMRLREVSKEIVDAFEEIGFVYLINHGIPQQLINSTEEIGKTFFDLPMEVKEKYSRTDKVSDGGYVVFNRERFISSTKCYEYREAFDVTQMSANQLPNDSLPNFAKITTQMLNNSFQLTRLVLKCIDVGLGLTNYLMVATHTKLDQSGNSSGFRILHYPPIPEDMELDTLIRCQEHTDYGSITLLFQDNVGGLEVKNQKNEWVKAEPVKDAILVNLGDLMEIWTNGKLKATAHRVMLPEKPELLRLSRRSFVHFIQPDDGVDVEPLEQFKDYKSNKTYTKINSKQHLDNRFAETYTY